MERNPLPWRKKFNTENHIWFPVLTAKDKKNDSANRNR
jgi:hypothetical protein